MNGLENLITDLKILQQLDGYPIDDTEKLLLQLKTEKYAHIFIKTLAIGGKPETALSDYLFRPLMEEKENLNLNISPQIKAENGWVDYLIRSGIGNPVAIELKPLLKVRNKKLCSNDLETEFKYLKNETFNKNQIIHYLKNYDSVILTNMKDIYYFNRESLIDFKPFLKEDFLSFIENLKTSKDIWDVTRRKEDKTIRHDLDKTFFVDLKKWFSEYQELVFIPGVEKKEKVVQLLNKFIFLKTLEDHALIPFNYIRETYEDKHNKWSSKGKKRVFAEFFNEINKWSYEYYDTELLKLDIFELLVQDENNLKTLQIATEKVLGLSLWDKTFGLGLIHYNYRNINEDIFGKAYETFLAEERKEHGIFYTPTDITEYMSRLLVGRLFNQLKADLLTTLDQGEYKSAKDIIKRIINIKIADLSCGSGSFLVKVLKLIWQIYIEIHEKTAWATVKSELFEPDHIAKPKQFVKEIRNEFGIGTDSFDARKAIALVILRHIFGADLDEKSIDVTKANIWKEAIKLSASSFRYTVLPESINHVLPDLELNFVVLNSIVDLPVNNSIEIIISNFKDDIIKLHQIRNNYLRDPYDPELMAESKDIKKKIRQSLSEAFVENNSIALPPSFLVLEFYFCFFDENGEVLSSTEKGFHGIIGNPPWENIKPISKEFAAKYPDLFGKLTKFSMEGKEFEKTFKRLLVENEELKNLWDKYCLEFQLLSRFIRDNYKLYGTSGDLSYQKVFLERAMLSTIDTGTVAFLVPSGFHTDEGQKELRKVIIDNYTLLSLMSFENRGQKWFSDVDPRFKFDAVVFTKTKNEMNIPINTRFYIHDIEQVQEPILINPKSIAKFSPLTLGFVEFGSQRDVDIASKIRADHPLLIDTNFRLSSEFHMTNDNGLFHNYAEKTDQSIVLYEGKMFHQYENEFDEPRYWIKEDIGRNRLLLREIFRIKKLIKEKQLEKDFNQEAFKLNHFKLDFENYRLAYRTIASSTNERTLIATILPPNVFTGHSINYFKSIFYDFYENEIIQRGTDYKEMLYLLAIMNSFVLDYYIRLRISANVTMFFIYELPIPQIEPSILNDIAKMALNLLPNNSIYEELAKQLELFKEKLTFDEKRVLRSRLESIIAKYVYQLNIDELDYILSTFTFGNIDKELIGMIKKQFLIE